MQMTYGASFNLKLIWFDWRVLFYNLKSFKENYNYIAKNDLETIWLPRIIFSNSVKQDFLKFDDISSVIVQRKGLPIPNTAEEIHKDETFDGLTNPIVYTRAYDLKFSCDFDLRKYPFDYQNCFIDVSKILGDQNITLCS